MADFDLSKGQSFDLSKAAPEAKNWYLGLGWSAGENVDLDLSIFPCKPNASTGDPELLSPPWFCWYNNLTAANNSIVHSPDNRDGGDTLSPTGKPTSDDEWAQVYLDKLDPQITELSFVVTIHEGAQKRQSFSSIGNAYIRAIPMGTDGEPLPGGKEIRYDLKRDAGDNTACQFGSLVKKPDGHWEIVAVGEGYQAGLQEVIQSYMPSATFK